jgi:hypothetical protein
VFLQKVLDVKAPRDLYNLAMSQASYKERIKTIMVTKNWTSKVGLSRFPNNAHEAFLLTNGEISQEKISTFNKKCMLQFFQKSINLFNFYIPFLCIDECTVVLFSCTYYESKNRAIPIYKPMTQPSF